MALVHHEEVTRAHALVGLTVGLHLASSSSAGPAQAGAGGGGGKDDPGAGAGGGGGEGGSVTVDPCVVSSIPDIAPTLCSENSDSKVSLTISNVCMSEAIEVFWVNFNCNEVSYGSYNPGNSFVIQSYKSHPWRVRNATTQVLLADIPPVMSDTIIAFP
ncbi:MAG: hypothetical protein VB934_13645 [Polyangiaceae bacterium]